jgi:hypothetical protein
MCDATGAFNVLVIDQTDDNGPDAVVSQVGYVCTIDTGPGRPFSVAFDSGTLGPAEFADVIIDDVTVSAAMLSETCNLVQIAAGAEWKVHVEMQPNAGHPPGRL